VLLATGCGPEGDGDADADADVDVDADADTDADADADADEELDADEDGDGDAGGGSCLDVARLGETIELLPDLDEMEIHPAVAFVDDHLFLAWNSPEPSGGNFDVYAAILGCDGAVVTEPFVVNTTGAPNDIDPVVVALTGGRVLVVWTLDDQISTYNMQARFRVFEPDGEPAMDEDRLLVTTYDGAQVDGNHMLPAAVALPGGGFAIAGVRGLPDHTMFQAFVQPFLPTFEPDGETLDPFLTADYYHDYPAVAADVDGALFMAWTSGDVDSGDEWVDYRAVDAAAPAPERLAPDAALSGGASMAFDADRRLVALYAGASESALDIRLVDVAAPAADRPTIELGAAREIDHSPYLALADGGGAVAWLRVTSGYRNAVLIQGFHQDAAGGELTAGEEIELAADDAMGVYQLSIAHVAGDVYFVTWSAGTNPDFRAYGQMVQVF
jgi:hypothetical protein